MFPLTPPKQLTLLISVALAIAAVVVRYVVYTGVQMPPAFPTGGFLLLLVAYLVLVFGNLIEGASVDTCPGLFISCLGKLPTKDRRLDCVC